MQVGIVVWDSVTQSEIADLINSMPDQLRATVKASGNAGGPSTCLPRKRKGDFRLSDHFLNAAFSPSPVAFISCLVRDCSH
jgi:hypothetical protein